MHFEEAFKIADDRKSGSIKVVFDIQCLINLILYKEKIANYLNLIKN